MRRAASPSAARISLSACANHRGHSGPYSASTTSRNVGGGSPTEAARICSSSTVLEYGGLAEERFRLGEEVRHRLDLVLRPEHELLRPLAHLEQQVDAGLAGEVLDEQREITHHARPRAPRVDLDRHLFALGDRLER